MSKINNKRTSIWEDAIQKKNEEATRIREASEFFALDERNRKVENSLKSEDLNENDFVSDSNTKIIFEKVTEPVLVYTNEKPFKNLEGRKSINNEEVLLGVELYGDEDEPKKWKTISLLVSSLVFGLILIPIIAFTGWMMLTIDDAITARNGLGYKINETEFAVKHSSSGMYLQNPTYNGEQVRFSNEDVNTFTFSTLNDFEDGYINIDDFFIRSNMTFSNQKTALSYENGKIIWTTADDYSRIVLDRKNENSNEYAIKFVDSAQYVSYNEVTHKAERSKDEDWFVFEAKLDEDDIIKTLPEYRSDYNELNKYMPWYNGPISTGISGNTLSIRSTSTGKWMSSYKDIEHSEVPFVKINNEGKEFEDQLSMSENSDTNLFIDNNILGEIIIGSYQTVPMDQLVSKQQADIVTYPIWTVVDGELKLEQHAFSVNMWTPNISWYSLEKIIYNETGKWIDIPNNGMVPYENTAVWLVPNPNNLREKAIYFKSQDAFLNTRNGRFEMQPAHTSDGQIIQYNELEYFEFIHSPNPNPEFVSVNKRGSVFDSGTTKLKIESDNPESIDGYEFYGFGYENLGEPTYNPEGYVETVRYKQEEVNGKETIILDDLTPGNFYQGILATYREKEGGVGKHITWTYIPPFKSTGWTTPDIDWPGLPDIPWIDWPNIDWPDKPTIPPVDPGKPDEGGSGEPAEAIIWNSSDEIGQAEDINIWEADSQLEISATITDGTIDGKITDDIMMKLESVDDSGTPTGEEYTQTLVESSDYVSGNTYTTVFTNLTPNTKYKATLIYYDKGQPFEQIQIDPVVDEYGETQLYASTYRKGPEIVDTTTTANTSESLYVASKINYLEADDQIKAGIKQTGVDSTLITTEWVRADEWSGKNSNGFQLAGSFEENGESKISFTSPPSYPLTSGVTYEYYLWIKMDTTEDFIGWTVDETEENINSDYFSTTITTITGEDAFDIIDVNSEYTVVPVKPTKRIEKDNNNDIIYYKGE